MTEDSGTKSTVAVGAFFLLWFAFMIGAAFWLHEPKFTEWIITGCGLSALFVTEMGLAATLKGKARQMCLVRPVVVLAMTFLQVPIHWAVSSAFVALGWSDAPFELHPSMFFNLALMWVYFMPAFLRLFRIFPNRPK